MVIWHSYVKEPEGNCQEISLTPWIPIRPVLCMLIIFLTIWTALNLVSWEPSWVSNMNTGLVRRFTGNPYFWCGKVRKSHDFLSIFPSTNPVIHERRSSTAMEFGWQEHIFQQVSGLEEWISSLGLGHKPLKTKGKKTETQKSSKIWKP